jgi:cyanophycin synthetase
VEFRKVLALRGPNIWANFPVLEAWVDLGELNDASSELIPGFNDRLKSWLPTMIEHRCSVGERGGFFQRLERGTYPAHILEHITLELQTLAGTPVGYGKARATSEEGVYKVAIRYHEEELGRAALATARELFLAAVYDRPFDVAAEVEKLRDLKHQVCLGPSTNSIVQAAKARGIPSRRLNSGSLVQLGYGARQRRILAAETDRTGAIAEAIAQDKELTRALLRAVGVPVPRGRPVDNEDDAWSAAQEIGTPVVVKPQYGNQGRGVATNLTTRDQIIAAYQAAREEGDSIIVERYAPGADWRVLVVGGKVVAASRREPAQVIGDGKSTIRDLVAEVNRDPRRSDGHSTSLSFIHLDQIALGVLASQGYTPDSVPPTDAVVLIRRNANLSTGGTATDVTDRVHPEVAARAVEAARVVGLDIAGVDVVAIDIGRPLEEQGGVIVEVNASPGLRMHLEPSSGAPRPVGEAIVGSLFPEGEQGRIPIVAVTGTNGKTTTTRFIAHMLKRTGLKVGMTSTDGIYIADRRIDGDDCSGPQSARDVLANPLVEAAVFETARGGILRAGLGYDRCDVAVVTNIAEGDHLGLSDIETPEQMAIVKRVIVEAVAPSGYCVLKADDPLVADMAGYCKGQAIFFCQDENHPVIVAHRQQGKRVVFVRDRVIMLAEGDYEIPLAPLSRVPLTHQGRISFQVENALAAAGAAWGLGHKPEMIIAALETFGADMDTVPGRFNLLEVDGATVILDYGHNPSALVAMIETMQQFPHAQRIVVYSAAGDRRDADMIRQGQLLGDAFDRVILYEDHYMRGRNAGEIMALFRQGTELGARVRETIEVRGALKAVEAALANVRPGELLLIQADKIGETVDFVRQYLTSRGAGHEISLNVALEISVSETVSETPAKTPVPAPVLAADTID